MGIAVGGVRRSADAGRPRGCTAKPLPDGKSSPAVPPSPAAKTGGTTVYSAADDVDAFKQGHHGWRYKYRQGGETHEMAKFTLPLIGTLAWQAGSSHGNCKIAPWKIDKVPVLIMSADGDGREPVLEWTAPSAGTVDIALEAGPAAPQTAALQGIYTWPGGRAPISSAVPPKRADVDKPRKVGVGVKRGDVLTFATEKSAAGRKLYWSIKLQFRANASP